MFVFTAVSLQTNAFDFPRGFSGDALIQVAAARFENGSLVSCYSADIESLSAIGPQTRKKLEIDRISAPRRRVGLDEAMGAVFGLCESSSVIAYGGQVAAELLNHAEDGYYGDCSIEFPVMPITCVMRMAAETIKGSGVVMSFDDAAAAVGARPLPDAVRASFALNRAVMTGSIYLACLSSLPVQGGQAAQTAANSI